VRVNIGILWWFPLYALELVCPSMYDEDPCLSLHS
jgi:hypothetical protein